MSGIIIMKNICVLIPSYNEARSIGLIVSRLRVLDFTVYVVDDGSVDGTAAIAQSAGADVIAHEKNMGKGASLREGFKHILSNKDFDVVIVMDGDGQHKVDDIDNFLIRADETGADIVIGNRMLDTASMPLVRIWTNRFMSGLLSKMCGQNIPDTQCGFKFIKRRVLEDIRFTSLHYDIESELIVKAGRRGFKIESVPIATVYQDEKSKVNPVIDTVRFIIFLIKAAYEK